MSALRRPPAPLPSAPAGEPGTAVDRERRRGRGTLVERFRAFRACRARRLRRRLAGPRRPAAVQDHGDGRLDAQDHRPQRFAGHFVRSLDQSLSRLRARLRLLFRAADARLSRAVAGARFRIQAVHEAERAGIARARIVGAGLCAEDHRHRHQYRSLSADRAPLSNHAPHPRSLGARRSPGRHRDQVGAGAARSRYPRAHGEARSGQGRDLGNDARSEVGAHHGAARLDAAAPARSLAAIGGSRRTGLDHGRAGHSGAQRCRDRAHPRSGGGNRRASCRLCAACACRSKCAICSANG